MVRLVLQDREDNSGTHATRYASDDAWTYAQAVTTDKREAQNRIAAMILPQTVTEIGTLNA